MENTKGNTSQQTKQLNQIIDILLDQSKSNDPKVIQSLSSLFDLLLWAEKRDPSTLQIVIDSQILILILQKYKELVNEIVSGYILLLGNAKDDGTLIEHLLLQKLPHKVLQMYLRYLKELENMQEDEHLHLLGSYLKAYHRHLTKKSMLSFIQQNNCLLIQVCCRFYNCPQQITRTSIMNILMNILQLQITKQLLKYPMIYEQIYCWCVNMCRLLRNQLKDFDQQLLITQEEESEYIINSINDKIILWEDLSSLNNQIFSKAFFDEIIVPLVVGSLNTTGIPLFTLKFSLFILTKLIKTIKNMDLINQVGKLLFVGQQIYFNDNQLGTAILKPFNLKKILDAQQIQVPCEDDKNMFSNINQLFLSILRSKDSRFLECICVLLITLLNQVKKNPKYISYYIKQLGFGVNGRTIHNISQILINQFSAIHSIQINRIICSLLVYIQPTKYFIEDIKNRFSHLYKLILNDTAKTIEKNKELWPFLSEIFEYDARFINSNKCNFDFEIKTDAALLFNNQIIQKEALPFYHQLPESNENVVRYEVVKCLLLRKLSLKILEESSNDSSLEKYLDRIKLNDAKYIKPGEFLKLPIQCNSYRCKILDSKIEIPNCLLLDDDVNLIIGYVQNMQIKIIMNIKMKHVSATLKTKKEKVYVDISLKKFDNQATQALVEISGIVLKNIEIGMEYFTVKKSRIVEKQIGSMLQILRRAKDSIPSMSLI